MVTTLSRTTGQAWDLARKYSFTCCAGVRACDIPVLDLDSPVARASVAKACAAARDADGCDVLVLGCAGMSGLATELTAELGIPVVDGVAAAVQTVAALVALGLRTSSATSTPLPRPSRCSGHFSGSQWRTLWPMLRLPYRQA